MAVFDEAMALLDLPSDSGSLDHMDPEGGGRSLCAAREPFELAFIKRMIAHHEAAIDMANVAQVSGSNDELKIFSRQVIEAQTAETAQLESWREQWVGATPMA